MLDLVDERRQPVRLGIQVWCINLVDVSCKNDLGVLPCPRDDRLDLVRRQVLGFVHDKADIGNAAPADICQGRDHQLLILDRLLYHLVFLILLVILVLDELQVVP